MSKYTAYEVLKDILSCWDISDLYYLDFYKDKICFHTIEDLKSYIEKQ